jgi:hypothetical protein
MPSLPISIPNPALTGLALVVAVGATVLAGDLSLAFVHAAGLSGPLLPLVRDLLNLAMVLAVAGLWWLLLDRSAVPGRGGIASGFGSGVIWGIAPMAAAWLAAAAMGAVTTESGQVGVVHALIPVLLLPAHLAHGLAEQVLLQSVAQRSVFCGSQPGRWRLLVSAGIAGAGLAAVQGLQGYASPIELANALLFGMLLGIIALGPGGILAAGFAHGLWTWAERLIIGDLLGAEVITTDPPTYLAGPGPDTYTSEVFSLCLIAAIALAAMLLLRSKPRPPLQAGGQPV